MRTSYALALAIALAAAFLASLLLPWSPIAALDGTHAS